MKSELTKYLGIPYTHAGRDRKGLDCWGLIILVYKELGIDVWDYNELYTPSKDWNTSVFMKAYKMQDEWYEVGINRRPYDALLFNNMVGIGTHAGLVVDEFRFIHAFKKSGVIISPISVWQDRIAGTYRHKELHYATD